MLKKLAKSGTSREELWNAEGGVKELALAYNVVSGAVGSWSAASAPGLSKDAWKASFDDEWIVGTLDYAAMLFDTPWIDDLKTGRFVSWKDYEAQQTFYCAVYSKLSTGRCVDTRSTLTHWPRYPIYKKPERFGYLLEGFQLSAFLTNLKDFRTRALEQKPEHLVSGDQCKFCPSRGNCPTFMAIDKGTYD